jgi:hypothetical protein
MLHIASPQLRMETIFTSAVSRVFALFMILYVWPDFPGDWRFCQRFGVRMGFMTYLCVGFAFEVCGYPWLS